MMRLKTDLLEIMLAIADGKLDEIELEWDPRPAICVVATSGGYPGSYPSGLPITGIEKVDEMEGVKVFLSGTKCGEDGVLVTDGGRVLGVTAIAETIAEAQQKAYAAMGLIQFEGMHYRKDIGRQAVR
jgi:phosphoribosylamine--glycine ligase